MPSEKTARSAERRRVRNRRVRRTTRTIVAGSLKTLEEKGAVDGESALRDAQKALDLAVKKGVMHPNSAARRKSRIMARANRMRQEAPKPRRRTRTRRAT